MFFAIFEFFLKIYQNMGQKLGSNRCPLFTMLTEQNSLMFCIVSFVKKSSCLLNLFNIHSCKDFTLFFLSLTWDPIWRSPLTRTKICVVGLNWDRIWRSLLTRTKICVFFPFQGHNRDSLLLSAQWFSICPQSCWISLRSFL